jgi:hypothetical protein
MQVALTYSSSSHPCSISCTLELNVTDIVRMWAPNRQLSGGNLLRGIEDEQWNVTHVPRVANLSATGR